jgi:BirA family biotin operon repressor/biotin-[acetyl-CoA-carboxylase] ligase
LVPLAAGVAVAEVVGADAKLKWPNDVLVHGRKVAGILVEGRPQEAWSVLGIGINVALREEDFPAELRDRAGTLGLDPDAIEPALGQLLRSLERWIAASDDELLDGVRSRDALIGQEVRWAGGQGRTEGIDEQGRLVVATEGGRAALEAGEVHLIEPTGAD